MTGKFSVPRHVMVRQLGDDRVILDVTSGAYFGLDSVGSRIWEMLSQRHSPAEICERLALEYDVTLERAQSDLARLMDDLKANGLLDVD